MSFILDALKKSEAERQRQAGPALLEMRVVRPRRRWPLWALLGGGALVLANFALLGWLLWRKESPPLAVSTAAPVGAAPGVAPAAAPAASAIPAITPQAPVAGAESAGIAARAALAPAPGEDLPIDDGDTGNPADFEPAQALRNGQAGGARDTSGLQNYVELGGNLPPLRLDLHVFAPKPADRYAFINMRKVKEGDITAEGARVLEITRDGVVLSYRNTEFILGRE